MEQRRVSYSLFCTLISSDSLNRSEAHYQVTIYLVPLASYNFHEPKLPSISYKETELWFELYSVLKNISSSIIALVTEKGMSIMTKHFYSTFFYTFVNFCELKKFSHCSVLGAHHVDFRSATKDDPDWLIQQRRQEVEIIQKWLNEYYADLRHA